MRRIVFALALALCLTLFNSLADAQEAEPPAGSLDAVPAGTPVPLPTRMAKPAPSLRVRGERAHLLLYFASMPQGQTGLVKVEPVDGALIASVRARWIDQLVDFYPVEGDGFYGLLSAAMEQTPQTYPLDVFVTYSDDTREPINAEISVVTGNFWAQEVNIAQDKAFLLQPDVERNELAKLESIFANITLERRWGADGFQMPIAAALTSPFGVFRIFNSSLNTRHTGWDIRTTLGAPVLASEAGEVVFAGLLDIRGNYVVVDHGYGVYTGYAHLSQIHVTRGQTVTKGQVLGTTGDTGRTSGPHFHWEMAVNGEWVDTVQFMEMWMP